MEETENEEIRQVAISDSLDADTTSGEATAELTGELKKMESVSGTFDSEFTGKKEGKKYMFGNGDSSYKFNTTSGSVKIKALK